MPPEIRVIGVEGMPEVQPGDDISTQMMDAADAQGTPVGAGDIVVVTQKVISKTEGRVITLEGIKPSELAIRITEGHRRDPRHTEMILRESARIVRM
ncbi:MAG: coenzyme F420-0:L-glutamate ligase, partial [Chloroflexota bacterium]|nr:coenzyme F420-0:L-glutamate ligase [Chloroflexota bacterium]